MAGHEFVHILAGAAPDDTPGRTVVDLQQAVTMLIDFGIIPDHVDQETIYLAFRASLLDIHRSVPVPTLDFKAFKLFLVLISMESVQQTTVGYELSALFPVFMEEHMRSQQGLKAFHSRFSENLR